MATEDTQVEGGGDARKPFVKSVARRRSSLYARGEPMVWLTGGFLIISLAMIAGLPALVSHNCGYAHYLADANAGLVASHPFRQSEFDALLIELLTSPERERWRANGLQWATKPEIYRLSVAAVDYFEQFARQRLAPANRGPVRLVVLVLQDPRPAR